MKNFFFLALVLLSACSQNNTSTEATKSPNFVDQNVVEIAPLNVSSPGSGVIPESAMDFGTLAFGTKAIQDLIITNSSSTPMVYVASDFDSSLVSPFTIVSNGCVKTIASRSKCTIRFELKNASTELTDQELTSLFLVKGVNVSLTGTLQANPVNPTAPVASISVTPSELNFGTVKVGSFVEQTVIIKNNGSSSQALNIAPPSSSHITTTSTCSSSLPARTSCSIKYKYSSTISEQITSQNLSSVANNALKYTVNSLSPSVEEPEVLNIEPQINSTSFSFTQPATQSGSIRFTNTGTIALVAPVSAVSSNPGVQITSISCAGGLARSKSCDVNYVVSGPSGESVQTIKIQSGTKASDTFSLNLNIIPDVAVCSVADAQSNGVDISNSSSTIIGMKTGSDVSQCLLASNACNQYYALAGDSKSCVAQSSACLPADAQSNGWNISQALTISGNRVGSNISSCAVSQCNSEYSLNISGKTCDGIACSLVNAQGNGVTSILNVASVSGNINDDSCLVVSCDQFYKPVSANTACNAKLCSELNAGELSSLGFNTAGGTMNGTYPSCSLSCNSSFQQLAADSKSCIDKDPSGTIQFAQDATKNLTPNVLNITSVNGQQIQFYSDASCSVSVGSPISLPLSSTNITLSSGDGIKDAYAKIINGTKSTGCLTDSIVLDQTAPSLAFTSPTNNGTFEGASLTVTGTCSDNFTNPVPINVYLGTEPANSASSSCLGNGTFSIAIPAGSLAAGTYALKAMSWDAVGNMTEIEISVEKIVPSFIDEIAQPSYDKMYFFAQENIQNHRGVELFSMDAGYNVSFEKDLLEFGLGYIENNPGSPTMKKLDDNNIYVYRSLRASTSSSFATRNSSGLLINPGQTFASEITETGFTPSSLYYSVSSGKYLYLSNGEIRSVADPRDLSNYTTVSIATLGFNAVEFNGKTYFSVADNSGANAVYYIKALNPNGSVQTVATTTLSTVFPSNPFIIFKNKLYMIANLSTGYKLYLINETSGSFDVVAHNTSLISIYNSVNYTTGFPVVLTNGANSVMVFSCNITPVLPASPVQGTQNELCIYDGTNPFGVINIATAAGTTSSSPTNLVAYNGKAVFRATVNTITSTQGGVEFVVYDPGAYTDLYNSNKVYVKDLTAGSIANSNPGGFASYTVNGANRLVFAAHNGTAVSFYTWDGQLPIVVGDLAVPNAGSYTSVTQTYNSSFIIVNNYLYYTYTISGTDYEVASCNLISCNMTTNGRFYDIFTGTTGSVTINGLYRQFIQQGNYVYFQGGAEANGSIWPTKVLRFNTNTALSYPEVAGEFNSSVGINAGGWMTYLDGDLIFMGNDANKINFHGSFRFDDLFKYSPQTEELSSFNLTNGIQSSVLTANTSASNLSVASNAGITYNGMIYLNGNLNDGKGLELLVSDGVNAPVNMDLNPGSGAGLTTSPNFTILNLKHPTTGETRAVLFFFGNDGTGNGLFMIDGNASPVKLATLTSVSKLTSFKGKVYFAGQDTTNGIELWRTDGTPAGTQMVADRNPSTGSFLSTSAPMQKVNFASIGYQLCMQGMTAANGSEIHCFDGDNWISSDLWAGSNSGATIGSGMFVFQNKLFFSGHQGTAATKGIYSYDGANFVQISTGNYTLSAPSNNSSNIAVFDNKVYFSCGITVNPGSYVDSEFCVYDGTTVTFISLNGDQTDDGFGNMIPSSSSPGNFIKYKDRLIFTITTSPAAESLPTGMIKYIDPSDNTNQINNLMSTDGRTLSNPYVLSYPLRHVFETF